ncbi:hypothetical protein OGAPHI_000374 [Ogataea philodendri]|uniref:Mediator of RNA polymerase II transcription subunit 16 n=1 Tax=Ogataea philodendri TaxID=1378263 RepID=A0A9P8PI54_9ASCO|nr:uncharacterized protein OGAPHI_000374 [Ogataea philodendri]KAH3671669.1 hypothetical protein OGAPHI_000374 [Ogataea philodendri]
MENPKISDVLVRRGRQTCASNQITWSRQGHLAYCASQVGRHNLLMTYLECVDGQTWQLAPPTGFQIGTYDRLVSTKKYQVDHDHDSLSSAYPLSRLTNVLFSNTGWDLFIADSMGHVSICVTGIKKVSQPTANGGPHHTAATPPTSQSPPQNQTGIQSAQYSRTSFNTFELLYTDSSVRPSVDLSTTAKREANQIISVKWLNIDKPVIVNTPAVKTQATQDSPVVSGCASKMGAAAQDSQGNYYTYNAHQYKPYGAMHPLPTKQACIAVRKNGEVTLWYQEDHGIEYKKTITKITGRDELLDSASIGFDRDGAVLIAANSSRKLKLFEITIDWGFLVEAAKVLAKTPTYRVPDENRKPPKLELKKVLEMNLDVLDTKLAVFTGLQLISPDYNQSTEFELLLSFENDISLGSVKQSSSLYRYQLRKVDSAETLHPMFNKIASSQDNIIEAKKTYKPLYRQKMTFDEAIVSIELLNLDLVIGVTFANGIIKLIHRTDFKLADNIYNPQELKDNFMESNLVLPTTVSCLSDAGFEFPPIGFQPQYSCISPNICCYVALPYHENTLHIRSAETNIAESEGPPNKKGLLLATSAAVASCHTNACYLGYSTDDLVATIRRELERSRSLRGNEYSYRLQISILQECQRAINLTIDVASDQTDKMLQNQPLQRILTLQLSLGTEADWERNKSGKIAWALVNLKFVTSSVMYTIHTIYSNMQRFAKKGFNVSDTLANARAREESLMAVLGIIRWCIDYIVGINQEIIELHRVFKENNPKEIELFLNRSVAVPLILGKVPRSFLIFAISNVRRLFSFVQKIIEKNDPVLASQATPDNPMGEFKTVENQLFADSQWSISGSANGQMSVSKQIVAHPTIEAYHRLGSLINNSPVSLQNFERFLLEADAPLRNSRSDPATSLAVEQQLICQGHVSKTFVEPLRKLCDVYDRILLNNNNVDVVELYFYDVSWLKLGSQEPLPEGTVKKPLSSTLLSVTDHKFSNTYNKKLIQMNSQDGLILDMLRRQLVRPSEFIATQISQQGSVPGSRAAANGSTNSTPHTLMMRKCIRCGAISSINDNEVYFTSPTFIVNPVYQHYQRICFCGGAWANMG